MRRLHAVALLAAVLLGCVADAPEDDWLATARAPLASGCSGVKVPDTSGFGGKVALTFDDGPNPTTTNKVLDVLASHRIKAAFLINGKRVSSPEAEAVLDRMVVDGHILGNHTERHQNSVNIPLASFERAVDETTVKIQAAFTRKGITSPPRYFRFPYGSSNCDTMKMVQQTKGYIATGWHIDSADWCFASPAGGVGVCAKQTFQHVPDAYRSDMPGLTLSQVKRHNGGIVLFHDIHAYTADTLDSIIRLLEDNGFAFVGVDDGTTFPKLNSPE